MVGRKKQYFWPRINILKGILFFQIDQLITVHQKVPKLYFQSQFFDVKNQLNFFKKIHLRISDKGTIF